MKKKTRPSETSPEGPSQRRNQLRDPAQLKPHPKQEELFGEVSEYEIERLAQSINDIGLQHPVEILPDGTIICGHQRVRAALRLA